MQLDSAHSARATRRCQLLFAIALLALLGSERSEAAAEAPAVVGLEALASEPSAPRIPTSGDPTLASRPGPPFVEDQVILRLRPEAARRLRRGRIEALASTLSNEDAAEFDDLVQRNGLRAMRRVFRSLEDESGRVRETTAARVERLRSRRAAHRARRPLPPNAPDELPELESYFVAEVPPMRSLDALRARLAELERSDLVVHAQPNYVHTVVAEPLPPASWVPDDPHLTPDGTHWSTGAIDPAFPDLYGVRNVRALEAWSEMDLDGSGDFGPGEPAPGEGVLVAVIDTGLDLDHPDIAANVWQNPGEIPGNGIDDDDNGFVDDVSGWDFAEDEADVSDQHGHGTHCAGTIAARGDNAEGIVGIAPFAKVLPVQGLSAGGSGTSADLAAAIEYATSMGADVLSNSWGGFVRDEVIEAAFEASSAAGALSVAAAGNDARDGVSMPALYDTVVAVCATDHEDVLGWFSSHGIDVEVCAPGVQVLSLSANDHANYLADVLSERDPSRLVGDRYLVLNGTSMATPHAAGVAAVSLSRHTSEGAIETRARLITGAQPIDGENPGFEGRLGAGRVDTLDALTATPAPLVQLARYDSTPVVRDRWVRLDIEVENLWSPALDVRVSVESDDPGISVVEGGPVALGDIGTGETREARFRLQAGSDLEPGYTALLTLTIEYAAGTPQEITLPLRADFFVDETASTRWMPSLVLSAGANFGDFDLDGVGDFGVGAFYEGITLYWNQGNGSFSRSSPEISDWGRVPYLFDIDGDGDRDLIGALGGDSVGMAFALNQGRREFVTLEQSEPTLSSVSAYTMTPMDIDKDGDLDLINVSNPSCPGGKAVYVYENDGSGIYTDVTAASDIPLCSTSQSIVAFDYDGDGWQDLLMTRGPGVGPLLRMLRNQGGTFAESTSEAFPVQPMACRDVPECNPAEAVAVGDYDDDGDLDVLAAGDNFNGGRAVYLFANDGSGVFTEVTDQAGDLASLLLMVGRSGASFFDLENDGDLDVILPFNILISGTPEETLSPTNVVLRNRGDGTFENVSDIVFPLFTQLGAYNLALGDYDRDGGIDLLGAAGSNVIEIGGMLRNIGTAGTTWLQVELVSTESAPGGFGAKLTLTAGGRTQFREVHSSPFDSSFEHFGLGGAELVDSLVIEWPSGIVQTLHDVPVNQRRVVGEIASTCAEGDDDDADGVCAAVDNCLLVANGSADARNQLDSDGDGFGDGCDADLNGDGAVGLDDVATILRSLDATSGSALYDPAYDLDGNGWITEHDLHLVFQVLGTPPGPSGVAPSP